MYCFHYVSYRIGINVINPDIIYRENPQVGVQPECLPDIGPGLFFNRLHQRLWIIGIQQPVPVLK